MLERDIEDWSKKKARKAGWWVRKFMSPANRSVPDDIFGKHARVFFIEFKATGKEATDLQKDEHKGMRAAGLTVYIVDSRELFAEILELEDEPLRWLDTGGK